jgi:hypothetical protein
MTAIGDMVSKEVRDRLDHLPHAILRHAARRIDPQMRAATYDDQWMPELTYILKGDESRPVTRLYHGTRFSFGILVAARQSTCGVNLTAAPAAPHPLSIQHLVPAFYLAEFSALSRKIHRHDGDPLGKAEIIEAIIRREILHTRYQLEALGELAEGDLRAERYSAERRATLARKLQVLYGVWDEMEAIDWGIAE